MLRAVLILMLISWSLQYLIICAFVYRGRPTVARWTWRDVVGHGVYYAVLIGAVVAVLNGARP